MCYYICYDIIYWTIYREQKMLSYQRLLLSMVLFLEPSVKNKNTQILPRSILTSGYWSVLYPN